MTPAGAQLRAIRWIRCFASSLSFVNVGSKVVSVLKGLVDGEMTLADGTRILRDDKMKLFGAQATDENVIRLHPSFRMIVLANRPGWPFLGLVSYDSVLPALCLLDCYVVGCLPSFFYLFSCRPSRLASRFLLS